MSRRPAKRKPVTGWRARRDYAVGILIGLLLVGSVFMVAG
jgi:hypothetical protein